jgi:hypothetical protein
MSLLGTLGGLIGLAVGGPAGAAIGSGIGTLAGGGDAEDAIKAGILGFGVGSIPGIQNFAATAGASLGLGGIGQNQALAAAAQGSRGANLAQLLLGGGAAGDSSAVTGEDARTDVGIGGGGGITGILNNPYVMAGILRGLDKATSKPDVLTDLQRRQIETGERMPGYRGRSIFDARAENQAKFIDSATGQIYDSKEQRDAAVLARQGTSLPQTRFAMGGMVEGPGTGKSDSIPAQIYQGGRPVEQAALSDGEFVMTADAVEGAGNGNRSAGAARMYEMMKKFEKRAA